MRLAAPASNLANLAAQTGDDLKLLLIGDAAERLEAQLNAVKNEVNAALTPLAGAMGQLSPNWRQGEKLIRLVRRIGIGRVARSARVSDAGELEMRRLPGIIAELLAALGRENRDAIIASALETDARLTKNSILAINTMSRSARPVSLLEIMPQIQTTCAPNA